MHRDVHLPLENASFNQNRKQGENREDCFGFSLDLLKSGTAASPIAQDMAVASAVPTQGHFLN